MVVITKGVPPPPPPSKGHSYCVYAVILQTALAAAAMVACFLVDPTCTCMWLSNHSRTYFLNSWEVPVVYLAVSREPERYYATRR